MDNEVEELRKAEESKRNVARLYRWRVRKSVHDYLMFVGEKREIKDIMVTLK